jgi:hypothetical protein
VFWAEYCKLTVSVLDRVLQAHGQCFGQSTASSRSVFWAEYCKLTDSVLGRVLHSHWKLLRHSSAVNFPLNMLQNINNEDFTLIAPWRYRHLQYEQTHVQEFTYENSYDLGCGRGRGSGSCRCLRLITDITDLQNILARSRIVLKVYIVQSIDLCFGQDLFHTFNPEIKYRYPRCQCQSHCRH